MELGEPTQVPQVWPRPCGGFYGWAPLTPLPPRPRGPLGGDLLLCVLTTRAEEVTES